MPGSDRTGPTSQGPRTGRGLGDCNSSDESDNILSTDRPLRQLGWGGRIWRGTFGRLFGRRRYNRINQNNRSKS